MTAPARGQQIEFRTSSTRTSAAIVAKVVSGDRVHLVAVADSADDWPDTGGSPTTVFATRLYTDVDKGTGVGEWQEAAIPGVLSAYVAAELAAAISELPEDDYSGLCAVPVSGSSVGSPALATPRRPSTTRPTSVTVYGTIALPSALLAAQSATVELRADASATPTTPVGGPLTASSGIGNVGTIAVPFTLHYDLPANHYYQVVQTAGPGGAVTITRINETPA